MTLRRLFALLTALGAALAVALPVGAQAGDGGQREVRLIVTAFKQELSQAESYEAFRAAVFDHFDTHVVPLLADDKPNLVVYPDRLDRLAMLIGLRGRAARDQLDDGASPGTARGALYGPYAAPIGYYESQFSGLAPTQYLQLALTDTNVRGVVEIFSEVAKRGGAHVVVGSALPEYDETTGSEASVLADPETGADSAYLATSPSVRAQTLVFGPDGQIVDQRPRLVLTSDELSTGTAGEGLTQATFDDVLPVDLPFGRVGVVAGEDAFKPDVVARLEQLGAQLLVQPLHRTAWVFLGGSTSVWRPDLFERGTWLATQRLPGIRAAATSVVTGNLGAEVRDGQAAIAVPSSTGAAAGCLVGTGHRTGWAAVGPWTDTGLEGLDPCAVSSREELSDLSHGLWPGSGEPHENAYAHGAVAADVVLAPPAGGAGARVGRGGFAESVPVDGEASQVRPSVAAGENAAWVAWMDTRHAHPRAFSAHSPDGGAWSEPVPVWDVAPPATGHTSDQGRPSIVPAPPPEDVAPGLTVAPSVDAFAVHPAVTRGGRDVYSSQHDATDDSWSTRRRVDRGPSEAFFGDPEDVLRAHTDPVLLVAPDGTLVTVWSDLRWPYVRPQIRVATAPPGDDWDGRARVDGGPEDPDEDTAVQPHEREPGETRGQASPAAAFAGPQRLLVAWQEPSPEGVSNIHLATSEDGGATFDAPRRIDGTPAPSSRPVLAAAGERVWLAWEDQTPAGGRRLLLRSSTDGGRTWTDPVPLDPTAPETARQGPGAAATAGDQAVFAFEDDRSGDADVLSVTVDASGASTPPVRVDDGPDGAHARAPDVAVLADGGVLVAWQDDRDGTERIRTAVRSAHVASGDTGTDGSGDASPPPPLPEPSPVPLPATGGGAALAVVGVLLAAAVRRRSLSARTWPIDDPAGVGSSRLGSQGRDRP